LPPHRRQRQPSHPTKLFLWESGEIQNKAININNILALFALIQPPPEKPFTIDFSTKNP
jgi:hypothetical protein